MGGGQGEEESWKCEHIKKLGNWEGGGCCCRETAQQNEASRVHVKGQNGGANSLLRGSTILQHGAHPALQLPLLVEHGHSTTGFTSVLKGEHGAKEVSNSNIWEQKMTCLLLNFTSGEFWRILVHKSPL